MVPTYNEIGLQFGVLNEQLKMIRKDYATEAEQCQETLDVRINDGHDSSWLKLIEDIKRNPPQQTCTANAKATILHIIF